MTRTPVHPIDQQNPVPTRYPPVPRTQALDVIKRLQGVMPIARARMHVRVTASTPDEAAQLRGELEKVGARHRKGGVEGGVGVAGGGAEAGKWRH